MKLSSISIPVSVLVAAAAMLAALRPAQATPSAPEQAIRPILAQMSRAADLHDTRRFMAPFLHASSLVFAINGTVIRGWNRLYAQQLKWWRHGKSNARYRQDHPVEFMTLAPGVEITTLRLSSRRTLASGKVSTSRFVVTDIWRRLRQGWRIVYAHESWANPPR